MTPFAPPIAPGRVIYTPGKPGFAQLASQTLGNAADPSDGFETVFTLAAAALSSLGQDHASLNPMILDLAAAAESLGSIPTADLSQLIARALSADTGAITNLSASIGQLMFNPAALTGVPPVPVPPEPTAGGIGPVAGGSPVSIADVNTALLATNVAESAAISAALAGSATTIAGIALTTVIPIIGGFIAAGLLLAHFLGGGCGVACIDAAKTEQIYEATAQNLYHVAAAGMITVKQAIAAMLQLIQAGQQHEAQYHNDAGRHGSQHLGEIIHQQIGAVSKLKGIRPRAIDIVAARRLYVGGPGWYADSLVAADQLTDRYLTDIQHS